MWCFNGPFFLTLNMQKFTLFAFYSAQFLLQLFFLYRMSKWFVRETITSSVKVVLAEIIEQIIQNHIVKSIMF